MDITKAKQVVEIVKKVQEAEKRLHLFKEIQENLYIDFVGKTKDQKHKILRFDDGSKNVEASYTDIKLINSIRSLIEKELERQLVEVVGELSKY